MISMSLSGFEIAVGGIASIPVTSGLCLLLYKTLGESHLDESKIKSKKVSPKPTTPESKSDQKSDITSVSPKSK